MAGPLKKAFTFMGLDEPRVEDEDYLDFDKDEATANDGDFDFSSDVTPFPAPQVVSGGDDMHRIITMKPTNFSADAPKVGKAFRKGVPVIVNMSGMKEAEAHDLVNFCAGLVVGLEGTLEKVTTRVFLLSPHSVAVTQAKDDQKLGLF